MKHRLVLTYFVVLNSKLVMWVEANLKANL